MKRISQLIEWLDLMKKMHGDLPIVMDEDGKGDISHYVSFNTTHGGNCNFSIMEADERLEQDTGIEENVVLINISF